MIIDARLWKTVSFSPNQCGFVRGSRTTDVIHTVRLLLERHRENNQPVHMAFLDLEKAFLDIHVPWDLIWHSLHSHGTEYIQWIQLLYTNTTSIVQCLVGLSELFPITIGVHQGSVLSPLFSVFCVYYDTTVESRQEVKWERERGVGSGKVLELGFELGMLVTQWHYMSMHCPLGYRRRWPWSLLFDIFQADKTHCRLERQVQDWSEWLDMHRLRLNIKKTEYMECRPLNKVTDFKYLGSLIRSVSDSLSDAHAQVTTAQMAASYGDCLWLPNAPTTQDLQNCLYAQSRWAVLSTDKHEQTLHGMEMKILRCSLSLTQLGGVMNEDVQRRMAWLP